MGYSRSPSVVEQQLSYLSELAAGRSCVWTIDPPTRLATERFIMKIRQALFAAKYNAAQFPELARAADRFSIHYIKDGVVEARPKSDSTKAVTQSATPVSSGATAGKLVSTVGKTNAFEITQAWDEHLPSSDPMHFPQTRLSLEELTRLYNWAKSNVPKLMLLVGPNSLTVSLMEIGSEGFEWKPADPIPTEHQLETLDGIDID